MEKGEVMSAKQSVDVSIHRDFIALLENSRAGNNLDEKVKLSLAILLYTEEVISLARAAELVGKTTGDFIQVLNRHNIPWSDYTDAHQKQDNETIEHILREKKDD